MSACNEDYRLSLLPLLIQNREQTFDFIQSHPNDNLAEDIYQQLQD